MAKTLADMTAEEREECVGMWADATHCALQGIIMGVFLDHARVLIPENAAEYSDEVEYIWVLNHVTPRFDLPRAWTPDGEPELAQALAEETYFYGVQVWMGGRWIMMLTSNYGTSLMYRGKWFERKDEAEECAATWNHDTPTRIVRQRRSPVEVINE